ncbi:alpha/beta hydrolase [Planctomicrobium sp. SH668]|uniref:alpha/beta hydrolase n=1 Tax=Planctomicrobium sp. SH668 TaxID=3448126 RepID=UPI003F5B7E54
MASLIQRKFGALDCHMITSDKAPKFTAILCHGYGAPGDDLVPIGAQLLQSSSELLDQVQFIFPSAPLSLDNQGIPGGRAWWPLNFEQLTRTVQSRDFAALRKTTPPGLEESRNLLNDLIVEVCAEFDQSLDQILLGGFSQGAMLTTDVALRLPNPPAGLVIWSGTLLCEDEWTKASGNLKNVPVVQSHGKEDPILPYDAAIALRDLLQQADANMNFIGFRGPHTIPRDAMSAVGTLIERHLGIID